jgi:hypothetical protein
MESLMKQIKISMPRVALLALLVALSLGGVSKADATWVVKEIDHEWTWFEEYVWMKATYTVECPQTRTCQVGMGVFAFGEPRGEKIRFSGRQEIVVIGIGSIHLRVTDDRGPAKAALYPGESRNIPTSVPW